MRTLFLDALHKKNRVARPPVWFMRQAGRYMPSYRALRVKHSFLTLCHEPDLITQITQLPLDELDVDAAIIFSDILMLPEALGFQVHFDESIGPVISNPLRDMADLRHFSHSAIEEKMSYLPSAIRELKKRISVPLIGFAGAPFTLASYIIEGKTSKSFSTTKRWAYQNPDSFDSILTLLEESIIKVLTLQIKAGCDVCQIFDSWSHVLSEEQFLRYAVAPLKRIVQALKTHEVPLIYFCKNSSYRAPLLVDTGITALSIDWTRPIHSVRNQVPHLALQGNLDPEALYLPEKTLIQAVQSLLQSMQGDPAYIFNLGHGILPDTPYQNVINTVAAIKRQI